LVECNENPGTAKPNIPVWESGGSGSPSSSWPQRTKKVYRVKQKANSNESLNLNTQDEKPIFADDKKQQLANSNLGGKTRGA
jgi:phage repressor protein C with HTH and peptisase S24 domain